VPKRSEQSKRTGWIVLAIVLVALNVGQFAYFVWLRGPSVPAENSPLQVADVTGGNRTNYLGKTVTLDGYFVGVAPGVSLLTAALNDMRENAILSPTRFLTIKGTLPQSLTMNDTGSRILLKGVIGVDDSNSSITSISYLSHRVVEKAPRGFGQWNPAISIAIPPFLLPHKYAVLISGGWDKDHAYIRYWNDLIYMYFILVDVYHYSPSNIFVFYKDGTPEGSGMPVNGSCTYSNIAAAFKTLAGEMTDRDQLFIYTTNHGNPALCLWNHDVLIPSDLAFMLKDITYSRMIIVMEQCYSGSFVQDLSGNNRVIITAADSNQVSYGCDTEGPWDEFVYHFMDAVRNYTLIADPVGADWNHDGKISMVEAFNYAQSVDSCPETPQFDDDGNGVSHSGWMPVGTDGYPGGVGDTTFL
jgi:hypothetical protein